MIDILLAVAGTALVVAVYGDALATTLTLGGAGPLSRVLLRLVWWLLLHLHRRDSTSRVLTGAGAGLLMATVLTWVVGLWAGWSLVLLSTGAVVDAQTSAPAGVVDVVYFAGFTVFTLGVGDFVASTPGTRLLTAVAGFSGLFLVTLAITYLVSVVSAVVERRAIAIRINALGTSAGDIVVRGWTGQGFSSAFVQQLVALTGQLSDTAEQHLAYPVLHNFRSRGRQAAAPIAIAELDDAMLLLAAGVDPSARPDVSAVDPVRRAVARYLETASATAAVPEPTDPPPEPDLGPLREAGIPVVETEAFAGAVSEDSEHRRRLLQLLHSNGWSHPRESTSR